MGGDNTIFSFFAGAGFLDLGFEQEEFKIALVNEFNKPFLDAYIYARKQMGINTPQTVAECLDIREYLENENKNKALKELVRNAKMKGTTGFIGGPPCPDFSVGGKNRGRTGKHGVLSDVYVELITDIKPDFFLFENVKGLWRTAKHREYYEELKSKLYASGYVLTEKLINALEYGVPQDRERIILIGFQKDFLKKKGIEVPDFGPYLVRFPWKKYISFPRETVFSTTWPKTNEFSESKPIIAPKKIIKELTVQHWFEKNEVDKHPNRLDFFQARAGLPRMQSVEEGDDSKKSYKRLHRWRYSPTACYGNNEVHLHPYYARRISVAESLAIQSLPKTFVLPPDESLTNKFKMVGNGVPFLAANGIAKSIKAFLSEKRMAPELHAGHQSQQ